MPAAPGRVPESRRRSRMYRRNSSFAASHPGSARGPPRSSYREEANTASMPDTRARVTPARARL
jgi:hypothetical protein